MELKCKECQKAMEEILGCVDDAGWFTCDDCSDLIQQVYKTDDLIKDRSVYGNYNTHVNQKINDIMRTGFSWSKLTDPQKTSLEMISLKVSRVLNGDPNDVDHWKDIAGYAELIVKELEK